MIGTGRLLTLMSCGVWKVGMVENDLFAVGRSVSEVPSAREFQENSGSCAKISKKHVLCVCKRGFRASVFTKSGHYRRR